MFRSKPNSIRGILPTMSRGGRIALIAAVSAVAIGGAATASTPPPPDQVVTETVPTEPGAIISAHVPGHTWDGADWVPVAVAEGWSLPETL